MRLKKIVILSGEIASGKSTLARGLMENYRFAHLSTSALLKQYLQTDFPDKIEDREFLQQKGAQLDKSTKGQWVIEAAQEILAREQLIVIDSARIKDQIDAFRANFRLEVVHIHLTAPDNILKQRFIERNDKDVKTTKKKKVENYAKFKADDTERQVNSLEAQADFVIRTHEQNKEDNLVLVAAFLKLRAPIHNKNIDLVLGGQFGSEGKGQIAGYLAPEYDCLIRVGGPNAGHKVYNEPKSHTFHIIPSGSHRNKSAKIVIGPGAVIDADKLLDEIALYDVSDRILIDENATIISQEDRNAENIDAIGSTKKGVGAATANNLFRNRLKNSDKHKIKNDPRFKAFIGSAYGEYDRILQSSGKILLEGTQGTFLDLHHGYYPYVTSRSTIASGCLAEAGIGPGRVDKIVLVVRRYPIRVESPKNGTSGPFSDNDIVVPELSWKDISKRCEIPHKELEQTERTTSTDRKRRVSEFNWALFRKACELNTATDIAFTFADYIDIQNRKANRFENLTEETRMFIEKMEQCSHLPVSLVARHFDFRAIIDRRKW